MHPTPCEMWGVAPCCGGLERAGSSHCVGNTQYFEEKSVAYFNIVMFYFGNLAVFNPK
jgi:hypothetical protein